MTMKQKAMKAYKQYLEMVDDLKISEWAVKHGYYKPEWFAYKAETKEEAVSAIRVQRINAESALKAITELLPASKALSEAAWDVYNSTYQKHAERISEITGFEYKQHDVRFAEVNDFDIGYRPQ